MGFYTEQNRERQQRRADNREQAAQYLTAQSVAYTAQNNGSHFVVVVGDTTVDFWPGSGKWQVRKGEAGRGVRQLVEYMKGVSACTRATE